MGKIPLRDRVILITGASTGIGRAITELLAAGGTQILACARKTSDIESLSALPNVTGVRLDVTQAAEIEAVTRQLADQGARLYAIINNAGIAVGGPMITLPASELLECLQVNTLGPVNVTRELYPFLEDEGRIVFMSSVGARYITPWMAPYHMSKFALEAYADALRLELAPFGTRVVIIEPGAVKTEAFAKWGRLIENMRGTPYEEAFSRYWAMITKQHERAHPPQRIAEVVKKALEAPKPKKRYLIPHTPLVRVIILLAQLGWSDAVYLRLLRGVKKAPPSSFR